jgi:SSS family solute:Na+ symporter
MLMNQGMVMRFLALRSVQDARRMSIVWILVLTPLAAITVSGGGWIARALVENGEMEGEAKHAFVQAAAFLCSPGMFGFVLAALMAALMSTADTLINAVAAVFVNDIYRPYVRDNAPDRHYLRVARITSLSTAALGLALVPLFSHGSIYSAHGMFTAAITPPIVMAILLGVLWPRFTPAASMATLVGGGALVALSILPPFDAWLLTPFSFGMGPDSYKFTRALYGLVVSGVLGVVVTFFTRPMPMAAIAGLVNGTQLDAMRMFKGSAINRRPGKAVYGRVVTDPAIESDDLVGVPEAWLSALAAETGDLVYVCDKRWWFGGLRSVHGKVGPCSADDTLRLSPAAMARGHFEDGEAVYIEKVF